MTETAQKPFPWLVGVATLVVLSLAIYLQTARFDFINLDDGRFVAANPVVMHGITAAGAYHALTDYTQGNWFPLTTLSYELDADIWPDQRPGRIEPGPMHVENALLHAGSAGMLLGWLALATGRFWASWFVAALFAVHPMHVESVAWIADRRDALGLFFLMASLLAYVHYVRDGTRDAYLMAVGLFALSLLCEMVGVTFPILLLLVNRWPLGRVQKPRKLASELLPFAVLAACAFAIGMRAQWVDARGDARFTLPHRFATVGLAYVDYLGKLFLPRHLSVLYPTYSGLDRLHATGAGLAMVVVTAGLVAVRKKRPDAAVGWLWFVVALVPVVGIFPANGSADRNVYLPSIGLFAAVVFPLAAIRRPAFTVPVAAAAVTAAAAAAYVQTAYWANSKTLYLHSIQATPLNPALYLKLGEHYAQLSTPDVPAAEAAFKEVLRFTPENVEANYNVGVCLSVDTPDQAVPYFRKAVAGNPASPRYHTALARAYSQTGKDADALTELHAALALDPHFPPANELHDLLRPGGD